jgi:pyrimidine-nucleoside phosphorylase
MLVRDLARRGDDASMEAVVVAAREGRLAEDDLAALARALADSGARLERDPRAADVASTGGPSSLSTLLCPLHLRARGLRVPKLGVPGRPAGGVDVLQAIPGFRASLEPAEVVRALDRSGYVHLVADERWAPLDAALFRFRQRVDATAVPDLVIASILAKKLAAGVVGAGLDVRVAPYGNFGGDLASARAAAARYNAVARLLELQPVCVLTDGTRPYQPFIGRGEALIAIDDVLDGRPDPWLSAHAELCGQVARAVMAEGGPRADPAALRAAHEAMLSEQGVPAEALAERVELARAAPRRELEAEHEGFVHYDLARLRELLVERQRAERPRADGTTPDPAGVILGAPAGSRVGLGQVVISVRAPAGEHELESALAACVYVTGAEQPPGPGPIEVVS